MNEPQKLIVMIDAAGRILSSEESIKRHNTYAQELSYKSGSMYKLLILSPMMSDTKTKLVSQTEFELIQMPVSRNNLLGLVFYAYKSLRAKQIVGFICGDPWESYWISFWLKKIMFKNSKIQLQLHGDFASNLWSSKSLKLKIRQKFIKLNSKSINSLRFTSETQQLNILKQFRVNTENQVVIPVPLNIPSEIISRQKLEQMKIGFVGRLHLERGLDTFVQFAEVIHTKYSNAQFEIIGDGNLGDWLKSELRNRIPERNLNFRSHLAGREYFRALGELSLLCSFAPSESYGRVAREALALGTPVLAVHSAGMDELAQILPLGTIHFLPYKLEIQSVIEAFEASINAKIPANLLNDFKHSNQKVISDLIESWIDMVKSD